MLCSFNLFVGGIELVVGLLGDFLVYRVDFLEREGGIADFGLEGELLAGSVYSGG